MKSLKIKLLLGAVILMQVYFMAATNPWLVGRVINQSDLQILHAARGANSVVIQSISQALKNPDNAGVAFIHPDLQFGPDGGCKIVALTPAGEQVQISFFGDFVNRIRNGRASWADSDARNNALQSRQNYMAAVYLEQDGNKKLIGSYEYETPEQSLAMKIVGSHGQYQVFLTPVTNAVENKNIL